MVGGSLPTYQASMHSLCCGQCRCQLLACLMQPAPPQTTSCSLAVVVPQHSPYHPPAQLALTPPSTPCMYTPVRPQCPANTPLLIQITPPSAVATPLKPACFSVRVRICDDESCFSGRFACTVRWFDAASNMQVGANYTISGQVLPATTDHTPPVFVPASVPPLIYVQCPDKYKPPQVTAVDNWWVLLQYWGSLRCSAQLCPCPVSCCCCWYVLLPLPSPVHPYQSLIRFVGPRRRAPSLKYPPSQPSRPCPTSTCCVCAQRPRDGHRHFRDRHDRHLLRQHHPIHCVDRPRRCRQHRHHEPGCHQPRHHAACCQPQLCEPDLLHCAGETSTGARSPVRT